MRYGSVCSGMEAAHLAFSPLGWETAWVSEIEPSACALLTHRLPDVPNLGDMTMIPSRIRRGEVEAPAVLIGGTPCQSFSLAGKRESLDDASGISPTLRAMGHGASHANGGGQVAVAYGFQNAQSGETGKGDAAPCVAVGMVVRRLTPRECDKLQGAMPDWTLVPNKHGKPMADGCRYRMLGNSFAVPCIAWIGKKINAAAQGAPTARDQASAGRS